MKAPNSVPRGPLDPVFRINKLHKSLVYSVNSDAFIYAYDVWLAMSDNLNVWLHWDITKSTTPLSVPAYTMSVYILKWLLTPHFLPYLVGGFKGNLFPLVNQTLTSKCVENPCLYWPLLPLPVILSISELI